MATSNQAIRLLILEALNNCAQVKPGSAIGREELLSLVQTRLDKNVTVANIDYNILYLEEKCLVKLLKERTRFGPPWYTAEITAHGIDVLENRGKYQDDLPFLNVQIQNLTGATVTGPVIQAKNSQVTINIEDAFNKAREITTSKTDITNRERKETLNRLDQLKDELKKPEADAGKIQRLTSWLKKNSPWITPIITPAIREAVKLIF